MGQLNGTKGGEAPPDAEQADSRGPAGTDFIRGVVSADVAAGRNQGRVATRFPPEPNGYLHIGHAKSVCLNFGIAEEFGGTCNLRFDDTNPIKEERRFVDAIREDVRWLGYDWSGREFFASDYFPDLYDLAVKLIRKGKAYVCDLGPEEIRNYRGTLTEPGRESPFRDRPVDENLDLFSRMRAGEFPDGSRVLRAKIDMSSGNLNMRDPVMYRIQKTRHHRTGETWCIYPMYDFAHPVSDALEGITHSLCTLEFEDHRPLYDWFIRECGFEPAPRQYEFARLNMGHTVLSKRKLLALVEGGYVEGWDDPRMPTLAGLRRRGVPPEAIRDFCNRIGVGKRESVVELSLFEHVVRTRLNRESPRVMGVLRPLKVVIENFPEDGTEHLEAINNPEDPAAGTRTVPFSRELYIERDDFMEDPPKKFFRLGPGREVRLKHAYIIKCERVVKDDQTGEVTQLHCTYDPDSKSGGLTAGRKIKGTLHWVSAEHAINAEVRLYGTLFNTPDPGNEKEHPDFTECLNPDSIEVLNDCQLEPGLANAVSGEYYQFMRMAYFNVDAVDSKPNVPVFNRTVTLRDAWAKIVKKGGGK